MEDNNNSQLNYIAIVGMAGRFPAASGVDEFWQNLVDGRQSSTDLTDDELRASGVPEHLINDANFVKKSYIVADIDKFDASFFGFTARDASITDPQQRVLLECSYEALENAGYSSDKYNGLVGVYAGVGPMSYYIRNLLPQQELINEVGTLKMSIGNEKSFASTMVSFKMDLTGPSVNVDTACSTSLVAVHQAVQSLLSYECDMALAGGVCLDVPQKIGMHYTEGSIISPDGKCRPFDADAKGTVKGNGAGIVALKRLNEALEDGDTIYAVIKGTAINNDGSMKVGYTASSIEGQADVVNEALNRADIDPTSVKFVEAHGTGTILGDPIEIKALNEVYGKHAEQAGQTGYCAVGSVKANVGHLDIAAGVAGLIKSSKALYERILPPSINYSEPNPSIDFDNSPFFVNTSCLPLEGEPESIHAGVSSFGIGGSNAHVILGDAPKAISSKARREQQLMVLSAKSENALDGQVNALAEHLKVNGDINLADAAFTLQQGRNEYNHRAVVVGDNALELSKSLAANRGVTRSKVSRENANVYFMFPGQGAQHAGMCADLYRNESVFAEAVDVCAIAFQNNLNFDIREEIFESDNDCELNSTLKSQPALFTMEYAMAKLWMSVGIEPSAMIGHSLGEYVAACLAGVFTVEQAAKLISTRATLMNNMAPGSMLMVHLSEQDVQQYLSDTVALAAVNGPNISVLSGDVDTIKVLADKFEQDGLNSRILHTSHAFHSHMLEPMLAEFKAVVAAMDLQAPTKPYISNVTGDWISEEQATSADYWVSHLRGTVMFSKGVDTILADKKAVLLEVGPGQVLTTLAKRSYGYDAVVASARHAKDKRNDVESWLNAAGQLWLEGVNIDWLQLHLDEFGEVENRLRIAMPTYQFDRKSYWVGLGLTEGENASAATPVVTETKEEKGVFIPKTAAEFVQSVWQKAFGVDAIADSDTFFGLGGDSLLATQLISHIRQHLNVSIALSELFEADDFGQFVAMVEERAENATETLSVSGGIERCEPDFANRHEPFPLTDIQQAYWVGRTSAVELGDVATHIYLEVDIKDGDVQAFQDGWNTLINHHDMLRAIFLETGEQQILPEVPEYVFDVVDLTSASEDEAHATKMEMREKMSHQVIPCDQWPLFDIKVAQASERKFRLCISIDILIVDAWSMNMLIEQWLNLYRDKGFELRKLDFSFRDYVMAEEALRETELYYKSEDYWFDRIDNLADAPALPLAIAPSAIKEVKFERRDYEMDADRWQILKDRAVERGVTPTSLLITAFSEVLALWCQSPKFTLNLTNYSRHPFHDDCDYVVGDFTSLTLLEVFSDANLSFEQNAEAVQKRLWKDLDNRYVSAIHVLREMGKRRNGRVSMPVVFTSTLGGRALDHENNTDDIGEEAFGVSQTSQVWLDHQVMEWEGRLRFNWDAVEELFPAGMIQSMFDVYVAYIERLVDDESAWNNNSLDHLLPKADAQVIEASNSNVNDEPLELLHESFFNAAKTYPDNVAVYAEDRTVTYSEIYGYSQVIAKELREQGVGANDIVGLYIEKGWRQIAAVMGILSSGGAYLPLDVKIPQERLDFIVQNSGMKAFVSADSQWADMPENAKAIPQLNVDNISGEQVTTAAANAPLTSVQGLEDLAYILYTSGSTGQPKGVMLPHRGPANTVTDMCRIFKMTPQDRVIGLSALHFDLSVFDVFGTLANGSALVMIPQDKALEPEYWHNVLAEHKISVWNSVPALVQIYTDYLKENAELAGESHPLTRVVMSGDWIPPELPAQMFDLMPNVNVLGSGGPTETSIWDASHWVTKEDTKKDSIPYGYPMANHRIHILNTQLKQCPVGVAGEMYVGGFGLAKGYINDEAKTNELFIEHPETGERLYKSGDLGRYTGIESDGIEILGRTDFQVKINGYRIELGEIESAIREHSDFEDVVVIAQGDGNDDNKKGKKRLVAYMVDQQATNEDGEQKDQPLSAATDEDLHAKLVEFKMSKPGIRKSLPGETAVSLPIANKNVDAYRLRKSYREYLGEGMTLKMLSDLLACLSEYKSDQIPMPKYRYASAGSLHPVQAFMYIKEDTVEGLGEGFYYYHPEDHRLIRLNSDTVLTKDSWGNGDNPFIYERAAFSLFLVGEYNAIGPVYGEEDANGMMYIEAGYMSQLLMEAAPEHKVGLCPIGYIDQGVEQMLGLGESQKIIHCIVGGSVSDEQIDSWSTAVNHADASANTLASKQDQLAEALSLKLPSYMLPSAYVMVDKIPLTANGKVDRKTLISQAVTVVEKRNKIAPKNEMEQNLLTLWKDVLGFDDFGTQDSFFEIGGDSVLILKIHQKLCKEFNVSITVVDLFKYPKIADLATFLSSATKTVEAPKNHKEKAKKQKAAIGRQRKLAKGRA